MATVGGSIESISLAGREFSVPADVEAQRKLGGFENEVMANGNGTARLIKTRVPLSINGLTVVVDDDRDDQQYLQDLADRPDFFPIALTLASGITWEGTAQLVDENTYSTQNATAGVSLAGPGQLTKQ
jgi:hypothetical protein